MPDNYCFIEETRFLFVVCDELTGDILLSNEISIDFPSRELEPLFFAEACRLLQAHELDGYAKNINRAYQIAQDPGGMLAPLPFQQDRMLNVEVYGKDAKASPVYSLRPRDLKITSTVVLKENPA